MADCIKTPPSSRPERLDTFLVRHRLAGSRRHARELIASGLVRVNGHSCRKGRGITADDVVEIDTPPDAAPLAPDPTLALEVLHADGELLVVNKPGLLPCHPLRANDRPTLINSVAAHFPQTTRAGNKPLEGGLVHRLDNGTSGATMVALSQSAFAQLKAALRSGRIERRYLALVGGALDRPLQLDAPIAHHQRNRRKMTAVRDPRMTAKLKARPASTSVNPVRKVDGFTLVEATPRTGSRHQIRVHLADAGFPIAGDELYGGPAVTSLPAGRFFLHLAHLRIPRTPHQTLAVDAPLPADLQICLEVLSR